jgi:cbb3-type cytochrome oxidase subunit 1
MDNSPAMLFALAGMAFGIWMSATADHALAPAHAHDNLIGWVTLALCGLYYRAVPAAGTGRLALVHFWLALIGALAIGPGIAMVLTGHGEWLVQIGSFLTIAAMALFTWIVFANKAGLASQDT